MHEWVVKELCAPRSLSAGLDFVEPEMGMPDASEIINASHLIPKDYIL